MEVNNNNNNAEENENIKIKKISILRELIERVYVRVYCVMFIIVISLCLVYGVTVSCVNLSKSYTLSEEITNINNTNNYTNNNTNTNNINNNSLELSTANPLYNTFFRSSNLTLLHLPQQLILTQTILLLFLFTTLTFITTILINELTTLKQNYLKYVTREETYSLELILKREVGRLEVKGFVEYFEDIVKMCINDKVFELALLLKRESKENNERIQYLEAMVNKLTLVQDVILLPEIITEQQLEPNSETKNNTNTKSIEQEQQQDSTHHIIVILSYPEIQQILLEWFTKKENKQKINTQILSIKHTQSPQDYLFEKLMNNNNEYKDIKTEKFKKYIVLMVVIELFYIGLLAVVMYFHQFPEHIFPTNIIESYNVHIEYSLFMFEVIIMFINIILFNEKFINSLIIKSIPECITLSKEMGLQFYFTFIMLIVNLFIVPFVVLLVVIGGVGDGNLLEIIQIVVWGECNYGYLLSCYVIIKYIIYSIIKFLTKLIKNCHNEKPSHTNQQPPTININHFHTTILESTIIFTLSIFINPFIAILPVIGIGFKIKEFIGTIKDVKLSTCFIVVCEWFIGWVRGIVSVVVLLGGLVMNSLLIGYGYGVGLLDGYYIVIISAIVSLLLFIFINFFSHKLNTTKHLPCLSLLPPFPTKEFTTLHNNNETELPLNIRENRENNNEKQIAHLLIEKIYTNQEFLFTFNEELRKNTYFSFINKKESYELNKLNSTNKITEELNTMSRSLEETLKQRLMTNSTNPFQITQPTKQEEDEEFDEPYEIKVNMTHSKPKTVRIPMLYLPPKESLLNNNNTEKPMIIRKSTIEGIQINNIKNNTKNKQTNLKNRLKRKEEKIEDSDAECDILSSFDKKDENKKNNKKDTNNKEDLLYNKKVKFTDLFDSDEESIKNIVKKKIKQSIPKISY